MFLSHFSPESRYPNGYPGNHTKVMYVGSDATEDAMWLYARLLGTMQLTDDVAQTVADPSVHPSLHASLDLSMHSSMHHSIHLRTNPSPVHPCICFPMHPVSVFQDPGIPFLDFIDWFGCMYPWTEKRRAFEQYAREKFGKGRMRTDGIKRK